MSSRTPNGFSLLELSISMAISILCLSSIIPLVQNLIRLYSLTHQIIETDMEFCSQALSIYALFHSRDTQIPVPKSHYPSESADNDGLYIWTFTPSSGQSSQLQIEHAELFLKQGNAAAKRVFNNPTIHAKLNSTQNHIQIQANGGLHYDLSVD